MPAHAAAGVGASSAAELLASALALSGLTLHELSQRLEVALPCEPARAKGYIGRLVERALGVAGAPNACATDFPELGVELKTLPVDAWGRPRESTFVCHVDLSRIADIPWEQSRAHEKLAHVLFVPIESSRALAFGARRLGRSFLWTPSPEQGAALRADYDEIAGRIGIGEIEAINGRVGRILQLRPKAPNALARTRANDADGGAQTTYPRAFYLRAAFTATLLRAALAVG